MTAEPHLAAPVAAPAPLPADRASGFAPDFFVIGAMKAGTTTLCRLLAQFDEIGLSRIKETDYFIAEKNLGLGHAWYMGQFDRSRQIIGEASPNYSKHDIFSGVPERIAAAAPRARLIFIARDPVDRFASHYRHSWTHGHMRVLPQDLLQGANGRHMLACSCYAAQIDRFLGHFDRDQFLFLDFDLLRTAPQEIGDSLADFLGLGRRRLSAPMIANAAVDIAHVPGLLRRAARMPIVRRFDRYMPRNAGAVMRRLWAFRQPDLPPMLPQSVLAEVAAQLAEDARRFRQISGLEFAQWRV